MRHAMIAAAVAASLSAAALVGCKDEKTAAPPAPATPPAATPAPAAGTGTSGMPTLPTMPAGVDDAVAKYSDYSKQVMDAVKSKKWDDAEAAMKKIEEIKSKLPASAQGGVDSLRKMLDAQKTLQGSMPAMPSTTTPPATTPPVTVPPVTTPPVTVPPISIPSVTTPPAAGDASAQASEHMRTAGTAIAQKKWDDAAKALDAFDAMKDKIPEPQRKFMEESAGVLRKSIDQGKTGG